MLLSSRSRPFAPGQRHGYLPHRIAAARPTTARLSEASDNEGADNANPHQPTRDEIEGFATRMMALAVEVKRLGEPYAQPYIWLSDAAEQMRRIYRMTAPDVDKTRETIMTNYLPALLHKNP